MPIAAALRPFTGLPTAGILAGLLALGLARPAAGQARSPAVGKAPERAVATEKLIRIPRDGTDGGMVTRICRPASGAPAPLAVINHGSPPIAADRARRQPSDCGEVAEFFAARGYVVAFPLRRGYGKTGGAWAEGYGRCDNVDFIKGGEATADDIATAIAHLETLDYVAKGQTLVIGQSAGGWGTLALARRNPQGVRTYINFAGGRGAKLEEPGRYSNCSADSLVAAAAELGRESPPSLWIYTLNDRLVPPSLSRRLHASYIGSGGKARYALLPPFGSDGHNLFFAKGGSAIWGPPVDRWLSRVRATDGRSDHEQTKSPRRAPNTF